MIRAKAYGSWYVWHSKDSGQWTCRLCDWTGRPLDSFVGVGASQDEAFADLQRQRSAVPARESAHADQA